MLLIFKPLSHHTHTQQLNITQRLSKVLEELQLQEVGEINYEFNGKNIDNHNDILSF